MDIGQDHPLVKATTREAFWALSMMGALGVGMSLALLYIGTPPLKLAVLASTIFAFFGVRSSRVFPFGGLFSSRTPAHLSDPILAPLAARLDEHSSRWLPLVSIVWLVIQTGLGVVGVLDPPALTAGIAVLAQELEPPVPWLPVRHLTIWVINGIFTGFICVPGSAAIFWLTFHLVDARAVIRERRRPPEIVK